MGFILNKIINKFDYNNTKISKMDCSICLGNITETDKIKKLSCNHIFHLQCFWI